ncbi:MAG: hypothetical protein K2Q14_05490 [Gammaproteobacteria bacterium]|nr:hypothetical protein [Gammaproteobacteria bacterium]
MPIYEIDFLNFAKYLINTSTPSEFDCRNAISRAYYSVYHAASNKQHFAKGQCLNSRVGAHEKLIQKFLNHIGGNPNDILIREVGLSLRKLKNERVQSDYILHMNMCVNRAQVDVLEAEQLLNKINNII